MEDKGNKSGCLRYVKFFALFFGLIICVSFVGNLVKECVSGPQSDEDYVYSHDYLPVESAWELIPIEDNYGDKTHKSQLVSDEFKLRSPHSDLEKSETHYYEKGSLHFYNGCYFQFSDDLEGYSTHYGKGLLVVEYLDRKEIFGLNRVPGGSDFLTFQVCSDSTKSILPFITLLKRGGYLRCRLVLFYHRYASLFFEGSLSSKEYYFTIDCNSFYKGFLLFLKENQISYDSALKAPDFDSVLKELSYKKYIDDFIKSL